MGKYNFDKLTDRTGTDSYKWDVEGKGGSLIPLSVADTDFLVPDEAIESMKRLLDHGIFGYAAFPQERFSRSVSGWYKSRHHLDIPYEWIEQAPGLMGGALWIILHAFTNEGDAVILQSPVYHAFAAVIESQNRRVVENPLRLKNGRYEMDFEDLREKALDPDVKMILLCSPHNPVGRVWTEDELKELAQIASETGTMLVSDEIHSDLIRKGYRHVPVFALPDKYTDNMIIINSGSKTFNIASLYSGYAIIKRAEWMEKYRSTMKKHHMNHNLFGNEALMACYDHCEDYVEELNEYLEGNLALVGEYVDKKLPGVKLIEPEGTYLLWLDFSAWDLPQNELMAFFEKAGVRVNDGEMYGTGGSGYIRMNIGTQRDMLRKALECIVMAEKYLKRP